MHILFRPLSVSARPRAGWICSILVSALLLADALVMLLAPDVLAGAQEHIGYPPGQLPYLAGILILGVGAFLTRRLGAMGCAVLTAFLGGAVASHARIGEALSVPVLICGLLGVLLWVGWLMRGAVTGAPGTAS
ncbi:hypothetical protein FHR20_000461 [Sphingomonas leidyi]|uniref:DoxX family protein n=1 Tax=Sphingomonas leidyi TaxID=68569 RepID=A0A7X5UWG2_9SPHN|nr:DoxX family protein [Sphingomonas leidyi]NIJ63530.1 hypothetical protein [Sphingomonas leidyi]